MIIKGIVDRRSIREFQPKPVPKEVILEIIKAAQFAPTSRDNRAVEFIIVTDVATKNKIYELAEPRQEFVDKAPLLIIPVTDITKTSNAIQDLTLATSHIMLQGTSLDLGTVWKNIKQPVADNIKSLLGLPDNFLLINVIPLGYPQITEPPHSEKEFDANKIHLERW